MVYKQIAIIYIVLIGLIFSLSFMRVNKNIMQENQLALLRGSSLVIVIALIILVIIFLGFKFFVKKK
jgi:TRAP-type mannitol/chloroaromatic compound transport system permease large subunit